jgi:IS5 family transposase
MDTQPTFAELEYNQKQKTTHRERFWARMDALIPWEELEAEIDPFYPRRGQGRPPYPLAVMLRVHCLQLFYNRSDPGMGNDLYEMESLRRFAGLRLGGAIPDETTILHFRHLPERHALGEMLLSRINQHLAARGLRLREGTVVDSTLIAAPSSTQNEQKARDPEMHPTRKGKNWYFGMKLHIGVDGVSGWVHSLVTTPANVHDLTPVPELLHGCERLVWGDAGYQGIPKRPEHQDRDVHWHVALRPGERRTLNPDRPAARVERAKSSLRAQVEHPFRTVKRHFGYDKVRYRGQHQNRQRLALLLGFHNLLRAAPCLAA